MGKLKFTLSNILFWIAIAASCLLLENVAFLSNERKGGLDNTLFFMFFTVAMGGYIAYFVIEHVKNKAKLDFLLLAICSVAVAGSLYAIWAFKDVHEISSTTPKTFDYVLNDWDKVHQTLSTVVFIFTLYACLFFFNKNYPSIRKIQVVFAVIMGICYIASIYSLIAEIDKIRYNLSMPLDTKELVSFFWNTNMFCGMLLMGILSSIGLNYFHKNPVSYISIAFFETMILFSASLTSILVSLAVILVYFLIEIIFTMIKGKKRGFVFLSIYLFIVIGFIILFAASLKYKLGDLSNFFSTIYHSLQNANYKNFSNRTFIWDSSLNYISKDPLSLMFGYGFRNSNYIIGSFMYLKYIGNEFSTLSAHSGYVQVLMNFGILGAIIYSLFIGYYIYCFIRLIRKESRFAVLFGLIGVSMLAYGSMESVFLFNPNSLGIVVGMAFFLPMINKWKHFKRKALGDEVVKVEKPSSLEPRLICQSAAKILMGLTAVTASFFAFDIVREMEFFKYLALNIIAVLFLMALTLPFIISCLSIKKSLKGTIAINVLNIAIIGGAFAYLIIHYYQNDTLMMENAKWVYPILMVIVLVGEVIIFGIIKRQTFKDYSYTLMGMSKNSFMGIIGVAGLAVGAYFLSDKIDYSNPLVFVLYALLGLMIYFIFSYIVPFTDQREFIAHYNALSLYSLKKDVVRDRLGVLNEKYRD